MWKQLYFLSPVHVTVEYLQYMQTTLILYMNQVHGGIFYLHLFTGYQLMNIRASLIFNVIPKQLHF